MKLVSFLGGCAGEGCLWKTAGLWTCVKAGWGAQYWMFEDGFAVVDCLPNVLGYPDDKAWWYWGAGVELEDWSQDGVIGTNPGPFDAAAAAAAGWCWTGVLGVDLEGCSSWTCNEGKKKFRGSLCWLWKFAGAGKMEIIPSTFDKVLVVGAKIGSL